MLCAGNIPNALTKTAGARRAKAYEARLAELLGVPSAREYRPAA